MATNYELQDRIRSVHLTKTESGVADWMLNNSHILPFITARDIADKLGISDTSVIRTCRALGYSGYSELQKDQQSTLENYVESMSYVIPRQQAEGKRERYGGSDTSICLDIAVQNLNRVARNNSPEKFRKVADLILSSEHVLVAGFRGMGGPVQSFGILLHQYVPFVDYISAADTACIEKMLDYGPEDCVILLSVERYSKMSCTIADMARESGARLITIVDKITAPVAYHADVVLLSEFDSPLPINSFIATQFIIETIIFEVSKIRGNILEKRLNRLDENLGKLDLW